MTEADRANPATGRRPRVLVLTPWFPFPQDNGSRQRLWALLGGLHERYDVDLAALVDDPVPAAHVDGARARCDRVEVIVRRPFAPRSPRAIAAFFHPFPRAVLATYTPEYRFAIDRLAAGAPYDAVIVSQIHVARYARHLTTTPRVIDDLEVAAIRDARPDASGLERFRQSLTWWKVSRYTSATLRSFDLCSVVSDLERDAMLELVPGIDVAVVPNGVDLDRNAMGLAAPVAGTLVHTGPLAFWANREGLDWFASTVLPLVREACPATRLLATSRTETLDVELPQAAGLEYTGYVDDIRPVIAGAWACVVPLRRGGGTRLKVLESLALGTPVVSTSKGVEGLDLVPGEHVLVADDPAGFAAALIELHNDPARRAALAAAGRRVVDERYGWAPIVAEFAGLVDRLVASRSVPARAG